MTTPLPSRTNPFPFDESHVHVMNDCLRQCSHTDEVLAKAKAAGLDVSQMEDQNNLHRTIASGLKKQFFPDHA